MRQRFAQVMTEILDERDDAAVILADISVGLFRDAALRHPDRVVNLGIREQLLVSVAGGMALAGMRPVAHTYAPFLVQRAYEQIKLDLTHQDFGAVLVSIGASFDATREGRTHQAPEDVSLFDGMPGWTVFVPGSEDEAERCLRTAMATSDRVYIRLSEMHNDTPVDVAPGAIKILRKGAQGTVVAVGPTLSNVLRATEGLDVTVMYTMTARPLDTAAIRRTRSAPVYVIVEPYLEGTSAHVVSRALSDVPHRLLSIGVPNEEIRKYGTPTEHEHARGLDAASLRHSIAGFLDGRRASSQ